MRIFQLNEIHVQLLVSFTYLFARLIIKTVGNICKLNDCFTYITGEY